MVGGRAGAALVCAVLLGLGFASPAAAATVAEKQALLRFISQVVNFQVHWSPEMLVPAAVSCLP